MRHAGSGGAEPRRRDPRPAWPRRLARYRVPARNELRAIADIRRDLPACVGEVMVSCYRRRRLRPRRLAMTEFLVAGGPDDGDDLAGVREPRRPRPDPGHLHAEAPIPLGSHAAG